MSSNPLVPQSPFRAPTEAPLVEKNGQMTFGWVQWMQIAAQQLKTPANQTAPASSASPGQFGQMALDAAGNLYLYVGTKWMKIALQNF